MPEQFAASDLILARSGASTVAELAASGKPSLLVPFPQAADDHQRKNAEVLVEGGAALMLLEQDMTADKLLRALSGLLSDRNEIGDVRVARTLPIRRPPQESPRWSPACVDETTKKY